MDLVIIPKILVSNVTTSTTCSIFGVEMSAPFGFAPWAMNKMVHEEGEAVLARVAHNHKLPYIVSTITNTSLSDIHKVHPSGIKMLQMYLTNNWEVNLKMVRIAEKNGFNALAITVDAQVLGIRRSEKKKKI